MEYAVIKTGGKQYRVTPGEVIEVERLAVEAGESIDFSEVLLVNADGESHFGFPYVSDALVSGKIMEHKRGEKIRVSTFKSKVRYRRVRGHRQELSQVMIESLTIKGKKIMAQPVPARTDTVESVAPIENSKEVKRKAPVKRTVKKS